MAILIPVLVLGGLGLIFGIGLAIASKKFAIEIDPKVERIHQLLPGANCGACGCAGCVGFAEELVAGHKEVTACRVSDTQVQEMIAGILGKKFEKAARQVAVLHCHGGSRVKEKYTYVGVRDCVAASFLLGGPKACGFGCIGFGTCVRICPFGAISMGPDNLPVVDEKKCTACGTCVKGCPKKLYTLIPVVKQYCVRCRSLEFGKKVMEVCSVGCIGCRKCEKACPVKAISIKDNLSVFDYHLCDNRGECAKVCPTKAIAKKEGGQWHA